MNKWNVKAVNNKTGKVGYPFIAGFKTKKEASAMAKQLNGAISGFTHTVVKQ